MKTTDNGGVHTTHSNIDSLPTNPLGSNSDAAVYDGTGTINAHLRGIAKVANERTPAALGQTTMAASMAVTIASDQSAVKVSDGGGSLTVDGTVAVSAGEAHLGEVGGKTVIVEAVPVISTTAYAAGDAVGSTLSFASAVRVSAGSGTVQSVTITDKGAQAANLDLLLFTANLSVGPTDNAAAAVPDADFANCVGKVSLTSHAALSDNSVSFIGNIGLGFSLGSGTTLYGILVSRGTPTYASISDLRVRLAIQQN